MQNKERVGELMVLAEVILFAFFPIIVNYSTKIMPPILFAGMSTLTAAIPLFFYIVIKKQLPELTNKKALKYIIVVIVFIVIIPHILIFTGSSKTSGINTTILLQTEILFTFLICGIFTSEKITLQKVLGAGTLIVGTTIILYNGTFKINWGDILIIAGTFFYPIGNIYAKKALKLTTPSAILFIRSVIGGFFLMGISLLFEDYSFNQQIKLNNIMFILINGVVIYFISKLLWYEGLKRLDISKAVIIGMTYPAFSMFYAYLFLKEIPTIYQWAGFIITFAGIFIITNRSKNMRLD